MVADGRKDSFGYKFRTFCPPHICLEVVPIQFPPTRSLILPVLSCRERRAHCFPDPSLLIFRATRNAPSPRNIRGAAVFSSAAFCIDRFMSRLNRRVPLISLPSFSHDDVFAASFASGYVSTIVSVAIASSMKGMINFPSSKCVGAVSYAFNARSSSNVTINVWLKPFV